VRYCAHVITCKFTEFCLIVAFLVVHCVQRWPSDEIPEFKDVITRFFHDCCRLTRRILTAIAKGLGLKVFV